MIKSIIFDIGGVLAYDVWEYLLLDEQRGVAAKYNLDREVVFKFARELWLKFECRPAHNTAEQESFEREYWALADKTECVLIDDRAKNIARAMQFGLPSILFPAQTLNKCTLYSSTEPCPMCAGAIFWSGIGRVVYALSEQGLYSLTNNSSDKLLLSCREVLGHGARPTEVIGPAIEDEAIKVHEGFWE